MTTKWGARWLGVASILAIVVVAPGCAVDQTSEESTSASALAAGGQAAVDLRAAMDKREDDGAALARQLAQLDFALTDAEKEAYVKAHAKLPEVVATTAAFERAAASLDAELSKIVSDPARFAKTVRPGTDGGLYEAFVLLAKTRYASSSLRFAAHLIGDDPAYALIRASKADVVRDLIAPTLPAALADLLVSTGSKTSALSEIKELLEAAHGRCDEVIEYLENYRKLTGAYDVNPDLVEIEGTRIGKSLHAVSAVLAIWEVGNGATALLRGEAKQALEHFVKGGPDTVAAFAEGVGAMRRIFQGIEKTPAVTRIVEIAGKVSAALTIVTGILETFGDLKKWNASDDAKVRVLGDLVSIGAGVVALVGFSTGGWVLGLAALGITLIADIMRDQRLATLDADQKRRVLPAVFPGNGALVKTLAMANVLVLQRLHDELRMGPVDIQRTAKVYPDGLTGEHFDFWPTQWVGLGVTQDIFALSGANLAGLMETVAGTTGTELQRSYRVHFFTGYLATGPGYDGSMTRSAALTWLKAQVTSEAAQLLVESSSLDQATWAKMIADAAAFLSSPK